MLLNVLKTFPLILIGHQISLYIFIKRVLTLQSSSNVNILGLNGAIVARGNLKHSRAVTREMVLTEEINKAECLSYLAIQVEEQVWGNRPFYAAFISTT